MSAICPCKVGIFCSSVEHAGLLSGENKDSTARVQLLSLNLFSFQKSGYLCDTVIVGDDGQVKAHGAVLAAVSPVFKRVLKGGDEPVQNVIVLPGLKAAVISIIIQLIYTGKVVIPKSECVDVVKIVRAINDLGIQLHISRYLLDVNQVCVTLCHVLYNVFM